MNYLEQGTRIWREFVPPSGQAETVQGELLRAVEKLRDEATRNGNGNWDDGFEKLLGYLERHLPDERLFPADTNRRIAAVLARLREWQSPLREDEPYDFLGDRVVDHYRHYGTRPHRRDPDLHR